MKETPKKVKFLELMKPSPKQKLALDTITKHKYTLYGGAMYGGKSYLIRWALLGLLIKYFKKYGFKRVQAGLFCEDYPTLKQRQLSKISAEFPAWIATRHADHKDYGNCLILDEQYGGGVLMFLNLDKPEKYDSTEFAAIGVDELTKNRHDKFTILRRRNRWTDQKTQKHIPDCKFIAGTNPGGIGHAWVKKLWMDREFNPNETEQHQFAYVPAKYSDNVVKNPEYEAVLNSMPEHMRRAFRDGDWDLFEGQFFDRWRRDYNVCKPFSIPAHWLKFIWMDYGYTAPSCVHWATMDEIGRVFIYRELYTTNLTYPQLAKKIREMTPEEEIIERMIADPAIFAKTGHGKEEDEIAKSGAEEMFDATNGWLAFFKGNNDRINGWGIMRKYIEPFEHNGRTTSHVIWFETCTNAIRTIPSLVYDSTKLEDVDTQSEDHAGDTDRYGLMDLHETFSEKPKPKIKAGSTDEIFQKDMEAIKREREMEEQKVDWENI